MVAAEASAAEAVLSSAAKTLTERAAIRTVSTAKVARFTATERLMLLPDFFFLIIAYAVASIAAGARMRST